MITLMLHFIDDEEDVFWMLHKIMFDLNWRDFYLNGMQRAVQAQERVAQIFESSFQDISSLIDPSLLFAVCQSIACNLIMSIFTVKIPLALAKRVFEYFLYYRNGEECLFDLLENILARTRKRMLLMDENELFDYLISHRFVEDCFEEAHGTHDWITIF